MSILSDNIDDRCFLPKLKDLFEIAVYAQELLIDPHKTRSIKFADVDQYNRHFKQLIGDTQITENWQHDLDSAVRDIIDKFFITTPFQSGMRRRLKIDIIHKDPVKDIPYSTSHYRVQVTDVTGTKYLDVIVIPLSEYYQSFQLWRLNFM